AFDASMCRFAGISLVSGRFLWRLVTAGYEAFVCSPFAVQLGKRRPGAARPNGGPTTVERGEATSAPIARRARVFAPSVVSRSTSQALIGKCGLLQALALTARQRGRQQPLGPLPECFACGALCHA